MGSVADLTVVVACDYFSRPLRGGAERVTAEVFGRIAASGAEIVVVSGVGNPYVRPSVHETVEVVASTAIDLSRLLRLQFALAPLLPIRLFRLVRRRRPDVIHASSIHFFGSMAAAAVSLVTRTPLVTTCHVGSIEGLGRFGRIVTKAFEATIGRLILARSAHVIAVSASVADHVIRLGKDAAAVTVVPNGVDIDRFSPGERTSGVSIAVVGRLISNKGTLETARAIEQAKGEFVAIFAGDGPELADLSSIADADPRIRVAGHRDDVEEILGRADIFVRYSTTEGRSLAVLEAMAAGCAVVVSDIDANCELVEDEVTGVVVPLGDLGALTGAIERLVSDADLRIRMGEAARNEVLGQSWETAAAETREVLRRVIDR